MAVPHSSFDDWNFAVSLWMLHTGIMDEAPRAAHPHWLSKWMDERGIKNPEDALRSLRQPKELDHIRERIDQVAATPPARLGFGDESAILAGTSIDLSGNLDLWIWDGKKAQLDSLFRRVWHYFDRVVVSAAGARDYAYHWSRADDDLRREWLFADVQLLHYIRKIGAEDLLVFVEKPDPDPGFLATPQGGDAAKNVQFIQELVARLTQEAQVSFEPHDDHVHFTFNHPGIEHTQWGTFERAHADSAHASWNEAAAWWVVTRFMGHLAADLQQAQALDVPLGSTINVHREALLRLGAETAAQSPLFHLELPVLDGIPLKELLAIRRNERDRFVQFRSTLDEAVRVRQSEMGEGANPEAVARRIKREVIEPELADLRIKLQVAAEVLNRKDRGSAVLAGLSTVLGVAGVAPAATALAVAATVKAVNDRSAHAQDKAKIAENPMFFLWEASRRKA